MGNHYKIRAALYLRSNAFWNVLLFLLIIVTIFGWGCLIPLEMAKIDRADVSLKNAQQELIRAKNSKKIVRLSPDEVNLNKFNDNLGQKKYVEQQLKTILALAQDAQLLVNSGDYKFDHDPVGGFFIYHMQFPIKGTYKQIRQFSEQVLLMIPYASLEEITFKRDAIGSPLLEAKLAFNIYVTDISRKRDDIE
ncbi:hypothetical protein ACO0KY_17865 [Undibacterium sp. Dicai25W]|uniref:hypothetical protein n=1 Tax=Undibacterium sp. Dicai25W TaxID=3413034 RepID=UPI003BF2607C